jgi:fructan beta-fructosidase
MILAAGQEMQIYSSPNLIDWTYESSFGKGQGAHGGVWECPDLVQLPVKGTEKKKWVLICNINPGGPFGGSATQYFVGQFDGHRFVNESPDKTKWMDWGKDHYATVTWSNAPDNRTIALAWMSNWDYANNVPTTQYRSANSVPRDLFLYESQGDTYMASVPSKELLALRDKGIKKGSFKVNKEYEVKNLLKKNEGAYEIELVIKNEGAQEISFCLYNAKGEEVVCTYNLDAMTFSMDRTRSGQVSFSKSFPVVTSAPVVQQDTYKLRLLVDKSSIEAFGDEGQFVMTNLVFPEEPYNRMKFTAKGGSCRVISMNIYNLNH